MTAKPLPADIVAAKQRWGSDRHTMSQAAFARAEASRLAEEHGLAISPHTIRGWLRGDTWAEL